MSFRNQHTKICYWVVSSEARSHNGVLQPHGISTSGIIINPCGIYFHKIQNKAVLFIGKTNIT